MSGKGGRPKGGGAIAAKDYEPLLVNGCAVDIPDDAESDSEKEAIRDAIGNMLTGNLDNLKTWLEKLGEQDPIKALTIFKDFAEYVLPKQQRTDSKDGGTAPVIINFRPASDNPGVIEAKNAKDPLEDTVEIKEVQRTKIKTILDDI